MRKIAKFYIHGKKFSSKYIFSFFNFIAFLSKLPEAVYNKFLLLALKPEELVEYSKNQYQNANIISFWNEMNEEGFRKWEERVVKSLKISKGKCLVLGSGCGRESIQLAKLGYRVTGIEEIAEMVKIARADAKKRKLSITYKKQDFISPDFAPHSFNLCVLFFMMYSSIPSSELRIEMLKKVTKILKKDGIFIFEFFFKPKRNKKKNLFDMFVIKIFNGNYAFKPGDGLTQNGFFRYFSDKHEIENELKEAGLRLVKFDQADPMIQSYYVISQKS